MTQALRYYTDINRRAAGKVIATASCSKTISASVFFALLLFAATSVSAQSSALQRLLSASNFSDTADKSDIIEKLTPHLSSIGKEPYHTQFQFYQRLARAHSQLHNLSDAHKFHSLAEEFAPEQSKTSFDYIEHLKAWIGNHYERHQLDGGERLLQQLFALAATLQSDAVLLDALNLEIVFALAVDDWQRAEAISSKALAIAGDDKVQYHSAQQKTLTQAVTLMRAGRLYREFQPLKAISFYEQALPLVRQAASLSNEEAILHHLTIFHLEAGNTAEAKSYIRQLLAFSQQYRRQLGFFSAYTSSSRVQFNNGDIAAAARDILRAEVHLTHDMHPSLRQRFVLQKALVLLEQDQTAAAKQLLERNNALMRQGTITALRLQYYELLARSYIELEQPQQANQALQQALKLSIQHVQRQTPGNSALNERSYPVPTPTKQSR